MNTVSKTTIIKLKLTKIKITHIYQKNCIFCPIKYFRQLIAIMEIIRRKNKPIRKSTWILTEKNRNKHHTTVNKMNISLIEFLFQNNFQNFDMTSVKRRTMIKVY